jgi:hypothetical protein
MYFILLLILCNFLLLNFFVGVSMEIFSKEKAKKGGYFLLSTSQRKWCDVQIGIVQMNAKPKFARPSNELRKKFYFFMQKKSFKWIEFTLLMVSMLPFYLNFHRASSSY